MKKFIAVMTAFILMLLPVTSYAYIKNAKEPSEVGKSTAELNGYTQEQWDRLADNRLEYREIRELIHLFNPDMDNGWNQIDDNARDMQQTVFVLNDAKQKTQDMYDDSLRQIKLLPPAYQEQAMMELIPIKLMIDGVGTAAHQYNENYKKMRTKSSITRGLYSAEDSLTYAVQSVMNAYTTVHANVKMLSDLVDLYAESVETYKSMQKQGMATEADVLKAQSDLVSARSNYAKLKATDQQLYNQLITMCGWKSGDKVDVGTIPVPDKARIDAMDPAADADKAANNNAQIKALHSGKHRNSSEGLNAYFGKEAELKSYVRANLLTVYADVLAAQQGYEAAKAGLEAARMNRKAVDTQYKQGQMTRTQYLGASVELVQKESAYVSAVNAYEQAALDYEAALRGNIDAK